MKYRLLCSTLVLNVVVACGGSTDSQTDETFNSEIQADETLASPPQDQHADISLPNETLTINDPSYLVGSRAIAMAMSNNTVIAPLSLDSGTEFQYAVYEKQSTGDWTPQQTITIEGKRQSNCRIAMDGNTAVFSFVKGNYDAGSTSEAYVYTRDSSGIWQSQDTLDQHDIPFSADVAISGNTIAISSPSEVFVYFRNESGRWILQDSLINGSSGFTGGQDRSFVSLHDDTLVAGTTGYSKPVVVYGRDSSGNWLQDSVLVIDGHVLSDIAIHSNTIVLASESGASFYSRAGDGAWAKTSVFQPEDGYADRVAVFENRAMVTMYERPIFFQRDQQNGMWKVVSSNVLSLDDVWIFGTSGDVAIDTNNAVFPGLSPYLGLYVVDIR